MATYEQWNDAITSFFFSHVPPNSPLYLSIDDDTLRLVARTNLAEDSAATQEPTVDFLRVVRGRHLDESASAIVLPTEGTDRRPPLCVAFLSSLVLAGQRMSGDDLDGQQIEESDYFRRLRELFELDVAEPGRPPGLPRGAEEPFWKTWNSYLSASGFVPTARPGSGPMRYINYPISQTLLREGDKEALGSRFVAGKNAGQLDRDSDQSTISAWVRDPRTRLPRAHLRQILTESDEDRIDALVNAIYGLFATIPWTDRLEDSDGNPLRSPETVLCDLLREEDPFLGTVRYLAYPKCPPHWVPRSVELEKPGGQREGLVLDRPGWFRPILQVADPTNGFEFPLHDQSDQPLLRIRFPKRDFWILVQDPLDDSSPILASWQLPKPGDRFLILSDGRHKNQLDMLRSQDLIAWKSAEPIPGTSWVEYRDCMVVGTQWNQVMPEPECEALVSHLTPRMRANVAFEGGLSTRARSVFVVDHPPKMIVFSGELDAFDVTLVNATGEEVWTQSVPANEAFSIPQALTPGRYFADVRHEGRPIGRRAIHLVAWSELRLAEGRARESTSLAKFFISEKKE